MSQKQHASSTRDTEMPSDPTEALPGEVPENVGVPRSGRRPFKRRNQPELADGLNIAAGGNPGLAKGLDALLQQHNENKTAAPVSPPVTKSESKPMSAATKTVTAPSKKVAISKRTTGPTAKKASPKKAAKAAKAAKPRERRGFFASLFAGVNDGYNSTMSKAASKFEDTRAGAMSRLNKIAERATRYRDAISESDLAKDIAAYGTETAIAVADGLAKAGMWTVEVLASGWILVTDGGWKLTLAVCDGAVWVYSYAAAGVVEAYESGTELLNSVLGWCEEHKVKHKDARRKPSKLKLATA